MHIYDGDGRKCFETIGYRTSTQIKLATTY